MTSLNGLQPKHDDGSTAHSPHRVYPPNFYTLIFRNHKTLRELKWNPLRFTWRPVRSVHHPCWNQRSASIRDTASEDTDREWRWEGARLPRAHNMPGRALDPCLGARPHRSDSHREASRKDGEQGWRRSHTRLLLETQATAARRVTLPGSRPGSTGPQPC